MSYNMRFLALFLVTCLLVSNVSRAQDSNHRTVEQSLELAGSNEGELKKAMAGCNGSPLEKKSILFLIQHMPEMDLKSLKSELLISNVKLAVKARMSSAWAQRVPEEVFLNDVLPYASINERRDSWRKDFHSRFADLVKDCKTTGEAAQELNKHVFQVLEVKYSTKRKKPDQSPYESMETGLASCTGLSVILTDACRSVGVPARLAGTPLWVNKRGNHTWVEVWDEGQWKFTGACEYDPGGLNRGWFQGIASQADPKQARHRIYATSFKQTGGHFPMVWRRGSKLVPGVDVTWRYIGEPKPKAPGEYTVAIKVTDSTGKRVAVAVSVQKEGKTLFSGKSRNESNDANDYFEVNLKPGDYKVVYEADGKSKSKEIKVLPKDGEIFKIEL